jgi:hypothetical protein
LTTAGGGGKLVVCDRVNQISVEKQVRQKGKAMENPDSSPQASVAPEATALQTPLHYGGIRRLPYLGIMIGLAIFQNVLLAGIASTDRTGGATLIVAILFMIISCIPVYYRLKNIGMNPLWCLATLVPILNLLVGIRCLVFQEGYADTKKLDTAGKVITFIVLGLFVLVVIAVVVSVMAS